MIEHSTDPNQKDHRGWNSLITAVKNKLSPKTITVLLENGANINYPGPNDEYFPLNISLQNNTTNITKTLLKYSPNLSFQDRSLNLPLHIALIHNTSEPILKYLIKHSCLTTKNIDQRTPLSYMNPKMLINTINKHANKILSNIINQRCTATPYKNIESCRTIIKQNLLTSSHIKLPYTPPQPLDFQSDILHNIIYQIHILKKYPTAFTPFQYYIANKAVNSLTLLHDLNLYRTPSGTMLHNILEIHTEKFFEMTPYLIIWYNKQINYYDHNLPLYLKKISHYRFIIFKLTILTASNQTHANIIIYDTHNNLAERFEPYGSTNNLINDIDLLDPFIEHIMKTSLNKTTQYFSPKDWMKNIKLQLISDELKNKTPHDPTGYCLAWCLWFQELKFKNPDHPSYLLLECAYEKILSSSPHSNPSLTHIRNYSSKLHHIKQAFLSQIQIDPTDIYTSDRLISILNKQFISIFSSPEANTPSPTHQTHPSPNLSALAYSPPPPPNYIHSSDTPTISPTTSFSY